MRHDFVLALRALRNAPVYAAVGILSLAVGIAANVTVFSVVNALLIRPLPVPDPDQLLRVGRVTRQNEFGTVSFIEYTELRDGTASIGELVAHFPNNAIISVKGEPRDAWLELVSGNYFSALRVPLVAGRGFSREDDDAANQVVVISSALWKNRLGGDPNIVGRTMGVNGRVFTIVGVAAENFRGTFAGFGIDAWVPATTQAIASPQSGSIRDRNSRFLMLVARVHADMSEVRVQSTLDVLATRLRQAQGDTNTLRLQAVPASGVHPFIAQILRGFLGLLQGVMGLVLVIACVNLANILLVRTESRRRDLAVRVALGAGPKRVARLVLAESVTIATLGGALGLAIAFWVNRLLERVDLPAGIPVSLTLGLDTRVVGVAIAITLVTSIAFGLGPALAASHANVISDLRSGATTSDRRRTRIRNLLVGGQVAVAAVLLVGSSLLLRSLQQTSRIDPGFDPRDVHVFASAPELLGYDEARGRALWTSALQRVQAIPGVQNAALGLFVPLGSRNDVLASGPATNAEMPPMRLYNYVSPSYFETLRIPMKLGRDFAAADNAQSPFVAIINEAMAATFPNPRAVVGRQLRIVDREERERLVTVVGVVGTIKNRTFGEAPRPLVYLPFTQWYRPDMVLHARIAGGDMAVTRRIVSEIHALEPSLAVNAQSMQLAMAFALIPLRVAGVVLAVAGFVGLLLAAIGVFGLVAYAVSLRTREIGVRMALGGAAAQVAKFVVRQGIRPVLIGLAAGLVVSLGLAQLLRGLLVGIGPFDPLSFLGVCVVLLASGAIAIIVPVRRAVGVDPATVLRTE
jgi:predicted permease